MNDVWNWEHSWNSPHSFLLKFQCSYFLMQKHLNPPLQMYTLSTLSRTSTAVSIGLSYGTATINERKTLWKKKYLMKQSKLLYQTHIIKIGQHETAKCREKKEKILCGPWPMVSCPSPLTEKLLKDLVKKNWNVIFSKGNIPVEISRRNSWNLLMYQT